MKEYIDKSELQQVMNRCEDEWEALMTMPSWFNAKGIIELQPTITEAEIRAKAIEDIMLKAKEIQETQIENLKQSPRRSGKQWGIYMNTHLGHIQLACKRLLAEQMKEVE